MGWTSTSSAGTSLRRLNRTAALAGVLLVVSVAPTTAVDASQPLSADACAHVGQACEGLRPGALLVLAPAETPDGQNYCTFGFILRGGDGHRYAMTAGHCLGWLLGEGEERVWPEGSGVFAHTADGERVGEFVYAIRTREITAPGLPVSSDLSLVRLDRGVEANPEVCAFGGPTGIDDRVVTDPAPLELRWFGSTYAGGRTPPMAPGPHSWALPARTGYSLGMPREQIVQVTGHAFFGDSGAPVVNADGGAVGLVSGPPEPHELEDSPADGHAGTFIVTRLGPQLARASDVLGARLSLCCAGRARPGNGDGSRHCTPCFGQRPSDG